MDWCVRSTRPLTGGKPICPSSGSSRCHFRGRVRTAFDLAHVPYFAPPRYATVPTIVTIHDLIPLLLPDYRGSQWVQLYMRLVSEAARRTNCILTDSHASARDIERLLGIAAQRIRVVYLASSPIYRPLAPEEQDPVLARLHIPRPYLLYLGGFDPRKNVTGLLQAFAALRQVVTWHHAGGRREVAGPFRYAGSRSPTAD